MDNKHNKEQLIELYGPICFLNGIVLRKNPLTVHHIVPKRIKLDNKINNLALPCRLEHDMFNVIEIKNKRYAEELNDGFKEFKKSKDLKLIKEMREFVDEQIYNMGYHIEETNKLLVLRR